MVLEGAQAGLSWEIVLKKRDHYLRAFYNFNPEKVVTMSDEELEIALLNPGLIRNRLKIFSVRKNAKIFLSIASEFGSFDRYVWEFVGRKTIINRPTSMKDIRSEST